MKTTQIPTKLKTAITREYKKRGLHQVEAGADAADYEDMAAVVAAEDSDDDEAMLLDA